MMNNPLTVVTCYYGEKYEKLARTLKDDCTKFGYPFYVEEMKFNERERIIAEKFGIRYASFLHKRAFKLRCLKKFGHILCADCEVRIVSKVPDKWLDHDAVFFMKKNHISRVPLTFNGGTELLKKTPSILSACENFNQCFDNYIRFLLERCSETFLPTRAETLETPNIINLKYLIREEAIMQTGVFNSLYPEHTLILDVNYRRGNYFSDVIRGTWSDQCILQHPHHYDDVINDFVNNFAVNDWEKLRHTLQMMFGEENGKNKIIIDQWTINLKEKTLTSPRGKTIDYGLSKKKFVVKIDIPEFQKDFDFLMKGYLVMSNIG